MRTKFYRKDLEASWEYYSPIMQAIFYANWEYYDKFTEHPEEVDADNPRCSRWNYLSLGLDDFFEIETIVSSFNSSFVFLLKNGHINPALALLRVQIENLTAIYAETVHPFQILYKLFSKNNFQMGNVKTKGEYLAPNTIRKTIDSKFGTNIYELYKKYSGYIHPSKVQQEWANLVWGTGYIFDPSKLVSKKDIKELSKDMVLVNQTIGNVLLAHLNSIKEKINVQGISD